ncbi:MAG: BACON domain-containing protein [Bacteroidales bacterium]|nr:BACON domain-containing protein [Bacteroidales bacterium]
MKLKYILASFVAAAALMVGCTVEEPVSQLSGLEVSNDYVTVAADAQSSATITVTADEAWSATASDSWFSISPSNGSAGQSSLTITATEASAARSGEVHIKMGSKTKIISFNQSAPAGVEVPPSTCAEVIAGENITYKVVGTVTKIVNDQYGNWYLADDTGEIYIYGTFNSKGAYPKDADGGWAKFGIEVGDKVMVEGPKTVYNGTVELVDVSYTIVQKSLIDASLTTETLTPEAGMDTLLVSSKVQPVLVTVDADWIKVSDLTADGNYLLEYEENTRTADRTATITIKAPGAVKAVTLTQAGVPATGMTVTEIIAAADDDMVQTLPSTVVVALTTRGAVLSDGTSALYAYGNSAAALKTGDGVKVSARKTTYNGVPELTDISDVFVDSEGNSVNHPTATDITAAAEEYNASVAEYIKLSGTLSVSGNYYNMTLDGIDPETKMGSIVYPVDELNAKSFDGKKITVTGYFNGLSSKGRYINIIATKIDEYVDNPKGTVTNPYTASEIAAAITGGQTFDEDVYIKGKVSAILYSFSADYGTATFWLSDDGTFNGSEDKKTTTDYGHDFECYSVYWFGNTPWAEGNAQIQVGDEVVVCGKTTLYKGVAETSSKKAWVYSVNGVTSDANGIGNEGAPFNVAGAIAFIDACTAATEAAKAADQPAPVFPDVCVKGKISKVVYTFSAQYGTATFWISDDGAFNDDPTKDFEAYSVYYFGNKAWEEGNTQIAEGDEVILKGQLTKYKTTYETSSKKAWVASLNGKTE